MDQRGINENDQRIALFSEEAVLDLSEIHTHTNRFWGFEQAEAYAQLIQKATERAARDPEIGRVLERLTEAKALQVRWKNAPYAHFIIYQPTDYGIYISRILHSAMDFERHLRTEE